MKRSEMFWKTSAATKTSLLPSSRPRSILNNKEHKSKLWVRTKNLSSLYSALTIPTIKFSTFVHTLWLSTAIKWQFSRIPTRKSKWWDSSKTTSCRRLKRRLRLRSSRRVMYRNDEILLFNHIQNKESVFVEPLSHKLNIFQPLQ